jgi:hypothetical protein
LLIYDNKENAKTIEWVTLIPDNISESNKGIKFTGKVIIEDWAGNFKKGYLFNKDGKIFNLIIKNENIGGPKIQSNDVKVNDVYCVSTPWYEQGFHTNENGDLVGSGYRIGGYDTNCYDTGSPYDNEDDYTDTSDETDGNQGETFPPDYVSTIDIINNINDPCLKKMVQNSLNNNLQNKVSTTVNSTFGSNFNLDLIFYDSNLGSTDMGTTNSSISGDFCRIEITINTSLTSSSQEYIAATIFHEAFHSMVIVSQTPTNANNANSHEILAQAVNFQKMVSALKEMFPNLSNNDAEYLTWGGLEGTQAYSQLSQSIKNNISLTNQQYKNGTSGIKC